MTESQAAIARSRKTVLLVDDDPGTLHVLSRGLGSVLDMFEVVTAHNGREAIEILKDRPVDALVTDLAMPVLDGFALIAYVTNMQRVLPLVVLSGLASSDIDERLSAYGGLRVLRKPASYQDVADQLLMAIEHVALGQVEGIPLAGVLQLVESERRSCAVVVTSGRRKGRLFFQSGRLINAFSEDFGADGEAAAYDILGWDDTAIAFEHLPDGVRRTIHTPMQLMLIEIAVTQDQLREDTERGIPPTPTEHVPDDASPAEAEATLPPAGGAEPPESASEPQTDQPEAGEVEREPALEHDLDHAPEPTLEADERGSQIEADAAVPGGEPEPPLDVGEPHDETDPEAVARFPDGTEMPPSYDAVADDDASSEDDDEPPPSPMEELTLWADEPDSGEVPSDDDEVEVAHDAGGPVDLPTDVGPQDVAAVVPAEPTHTVERTQQHDPQVAALLSAVGRLTERARAADEALAAVTAEVAAFREAQRSFDAAVARRERRHRELEAFRNDVAGLAQQILERVDAMFSEPSDEAATAPEAEARRAP